MKKNKNKKNKKKSQSNENIKTIINIILLIIVSLPLIYTLIKGENNFFSLASILLIIYSIFKYAYLKYIFQIVKTKNLM